MRNVFLTAALVSATCAVGQTLAPAQAPRPRFTLSTTAFEDGGVVPVKYSQAAPTGAVSPALSWTGIPDGAVSFAVIVIDPDTAPAKSTTEVLHWMIFNIPGTVHELPEGVPSDPKLPEGEVQLPNQAKKIGYLGMGAPAPGPYHHYTWAVYALDTKLAQGPDSSREDVMKAMDGHILGKAVLVGRFHRP